MLITTLLQRVLSRHIVMVQGLIAQKTTPTWDSMYELNKKKLVTYNILSSLGGGGVIYNIGDLRGGPI